MDKQAEVQVTPVTVDESERKRSERNHCESEIEAGLKMAEAGRLKAGKYLQRVRDERLYHPDFFTFEDYCTSRWKWTPQWANQLIKATQVGRNGKSSESSLSQTSPSQPTSPDSPVTPTPEQQQEDGSEGVEPTNGDLPLEQTQVTLGEVLNGDSGTNGEAAESLTPEILPATDSLPSTEDSTEPPDPEAVDALLSDESETENEPDAMDDESEMADESEMGEKTMKSSGSASKKSSAKPAAKTFNETTDMVDWARWTWNPVTGCNHGCPFCYARVIANQRYKEKFAPTFRPERLNEPQDTRLPRKAALEKNPVERTAWRNVFCCSMADLFGGWVPREWIDAVFDSCRRSPQWNYLFLTKYPLRYVGLDFPPTSWVGTSVVEQKWVANAEKAFAQIKAPVKWLSIEPMLERIVFNDLSMFDWVVIGSQSRQPGVLGFPSVPEFHPDPLWVYDLVIKAKDAGCKVYLKPNTFVGQGWQIKEYPSVFGGNSD